MTVGALGNIKPGERELNGLKDFRPPTTNIYRSELKAHLKKYNIPLKDGWDADRLYDEVLSEPKSTRVPSADYLDETYIASQKALYKNGASRIVIEDSLNFNGPSQIDGSAFVKPKEVMNQLLLEAGGDKDKLARRMGVDPELWKNKRLVRVDIDNPNISGLDLRLPTGKEVPNNPDVGANKEWLPGGRTPDGTSEAVVTLSKDQEGSVWRRALTF